MTSPFSGGKGPLIIDLMPVHKGLTTPTTTPSQMNINNASTMLQLGVYIDWSVITGTFNWFVVFGHDAITTTGNIMVQLVDITNSSTVLATASTNVSTAINDFRLAIATSFLITKPAGKARVGMSAINNDVVNRGIEFWNSHIVVT